MPWINLHRKIICHACGGLCGKWERENRETVWTICKECDGRGYWTIPYLGWVSKKELKKIQEQTEDEDN